MEDKEIRARYDAFVAAMTPKEKKSMAERVFYYTGRGKSQHKYDINDARRIVMGEMKAGVKRGRPRKSRGVAVTPLGFDAQRHLMDYRAAKAAKEAMVGELKDVDRSLREVEMYGTSPFFPTQDEYIDARAAKAHRDIMIYGGAFALPSPPSSQVDYDMSKHMHHLHSDEPMHFNREKPRHRMYVDYMSESDYDSESEDADGVL